VIYPNKIFGGGGMARPATPNHHMLMVHILCVQQKVKGNAGAP